MAHNVPEDLIQLADAAKIFGTCRQTVLRWVISGKLTGYRIGYRWRVSRADVLAFIRIWTVSDANDKKIEAERTRPQTRQELARREKETDEYLRKAGIRK